MSQENKEKKFKDNGLMMKIAVTSLLTALLMMIEIYEIINDSANLIAIGSLGVFILVSVFSTALLIGRLNELKAKQQEEAFDNVLRSEKASYLLMRKYFDKMEQKMDSINENAGLPYKELVSAQKALAKAQINRNKQNTNALLMSNDRIMQKLSSFQKELANQKNTAGQDVTFNPGELANVTAGLSEQDKAELKESLSERVAESSKDILASQKEILSGIKEMEKSLRSEIAESASRAVSMKSQLKPLDMEDEESEVDYFDRLTTGECPEDYIIKDELKKYVKFFVDGLPDKFRNIIILREVEDLSYEEIAEMLNISLGTVRSRLFNARQIIKERLIKQGLIDNAFAEAK